MGGFTQRQWVPTKRRGPIAAESKSPGPASVALPSLIGGRNVPVSQLNRAPAYTFGFRHNDKNDSVGPGPCQYNVYGLSAKGKASPPAVSIHHRSKEAAGFTTPAPGDYAPERSVKALLDTSPKFTIGIRVGADKKSDTPAPNLYTIPSMLGGSKEGNKRAAPAFTISGRQREAIDDRIKNPGAGTYDPMDTGVKHRSPAFSISTRYEQPRDHSQKPGPGAHCPEKVNLDLPPAHSFGIKHSPYSNNY